MFRKKIPFIDLVCVLEQQKNCTARFVDDFVSGAEISRDGKHVAAILKKDGAFNTYVWKIIIFDKQLDYELEQLLGMSYYKVRIVGEGYKK